MRSGRHPGWGQPNEPEDWIAELRERSHELSESIGLVSAQAAVNARDLKELSARVDQLARIGEQVEANTLRITTLTDELRKAQAADAIADAVDTRMRAQLAERDAERTRRRARWSNGYTKLIAGVTGLVLLAASIKGLFGL